MKPLAVFLLGAAIGWLLVRRRKPEPKPAAWTWTSRDGVVTYAYPDTWLGRTWT